MNNHVAMLTHLQQPLSHPVRVYKDSNPSIGAESDVRFTPKAVTTGTYCGGGYTHR